MIRRFFASIHLHLLFIALAQVLYSVIYLFRPEVLSSYWLYFYTAICLFIYLAAGWIIRYELKKNWPALAGGFIVFLTGFIVQYLGVFVIAPSMNPQRAFTNNTILLKFIHYEVYYAGIAVVLALIGAHLCGQYLRYKQRN